MITEAQQEEAEEVVMKYRRIIHLDIEHAINCAIQDRQSALDLAKVAVQTAADEHDEFWQNEIQSLTNQIEYLKN